MRGLDLSRVLKDEGALWEKTPQADEPREPMTGQVPWQRGLAEERWEGRLSGGYFLKALTCQTQVGSIPKTSVSDRRHDQQWQKGERSCGHDTLCRAQPGLLPACFIFVSLKNRVRDRGRKEFPLSLVHASKMATGIGFQLREAWSS